MNSLEELKQRKLNQEENSFKIFSKIAENSLSEEVSIASVKILQKIELSFYTAELKKRHILCDLAQNCKKEAIALAALESLFEESNKDYNLEDKRFFQ